MAQDTTQVLVGTGDLYTAPLAEAFPADAETTPAGNWEHAGYTEDGAAFEWDQTFEDIRVAELAEPVDTRWTEVEYRLVTSLAQFSLESVQLALNGGTITSIPGPPVERTYEPPSVGGDTALSGLFRFGNEYAFNTDLQLRKIRSVAAATVPFRKAPDKAMIPITWKLATPSAGAVFTLREYVSAS